MRPVTLRRLRRSFAAVAVPGLLLLATACGASGRLRDPAALENLPWTAAEASRAAHAVRVGLEEMRAFFVADPERVLRLGVDAVECLIDASYAADNTPELRASARAYARENLEALLAASAKTRPATVSADDYGDCATFAVYAHLLLPEGDPRTAHTIACANAAAAQCMSLADAMGFDPFDLLKPSTIGHDDDAETRAEALVDRVYETVLWSITFTDASTVPGLDVPPRAHELLPALWNFLSTYPLPDAAKFADGANDMRFYDAAYLATHIGYVPTGYGRHALRIEDCPWLLRYLRTNFDAVLAMGELDLVAEFVDLLRQFGFDEADPQVLAGSRHLLAQFERAGSSWMAHREEDEDEVTEYDLIHKPWTAVAGLRVRSPEPLRPGTYGAAFRAALARTP